MNESICFFTTSADQSQKAAALFKQYKLPIRCETSAPGRFARDAVALSREGVSVFIARGSIVSYILNAVKVPVIQLRYDLLDFLKAIRKAQEVSDKIALVGWYSADPWVQNYLAYMPKSVRFFLLHHFSDPNYSELQETILKCREEGIEVIIGGASVTAEAEKLGLTGVDIEISDEVYLYAAREAMRENMLLKEQELRFRQMREIVEKVDEGLILTDYQWNILHTNHLACELLPGLGNCCSLRDYAPAKAFLNKPITPDTVRDHVFTIHGKRLFLNVSRMPAKDSTVNYLWRIQEAEKIAETERRFRKDLVAKGLIARHTFSDIIGNSKAMHHCIQMARLYAQSDETVLIYGETGAGKELFAQSIHNASRRCKEPFVAINCAALPESLLESELFGYVKGAFTGARSEGRAGIFETANKGTIFLDEIGEVSPAIQARLLRVIQEREIVRVGDTRVIPIDVRIITATNRNLLVEASQGRFREDLYYRLAVLILNVVPLRQRKEDILLLADALIQQHRAGNYHWTQEARSIIADWDWPGNVRELTNFIKRLLILYPDGAPSAPELRQLLHPLENQPGSGEEPCAGNTSGNTETEKEHILAVLDACRWNREKAAARLGMSRTALWRRLREIDASNSLPKK